MRNANGYVNSIKVFSAHIGPFSVNVWSKSWSYTEPLVTDEHAPGVEIVVERGDSHYMGPREGAVLIGILEAAFAALPAAEEAAREAQNQLERGQ